MKKHKISEMMLRIRTVYCTEIRKICFCDSYINTYPPSFQATFYNYLYNFLYVFIKKIIQVCRGILLSISAILPEAISDGELTPITDIKSRKSSSSITKFSLSFSFKISYCDPVFFPVFSV